MSAPSLDGRTFVEIGEAGERTTYHYTETGNMITATYAGGVIRRGFLVGLRDGDCLNLRYVHLYVDGTTSTGRVVTEIQTLDDGRVRLLETTTCEARRDAQGIVEELPSWAKPRS